MNEVIGKKGKVKEQINQEKHDGRGNTMKEWNENRNRKNEMKTEKQKRNGDGKRERKTIRESKKWSR